MTKASIKRHVQFGDVMKEIGRNRIGKMPCDLTRNGRVAAFENIYATPTSAMYRFVKNVFAYNQIDSIAEFFFLIESIRKMSSVWKFHMCIVNGFS